MTGVDMTLDAALEASRPATVARAAPVTSGDPRRAGLLPAFTCTLSLVGSPRVPPAGR